MKYLVINLPKETKDLYSENCKTLMKEIEDDTNRWKDIPCSQIGTINIQNDYTTQVKFNAIPMKLMALFTELKQKSFKSV